jgi:hypothetical protein
VGEKSQYDYNVVFTDAQRAHMLYNKLQKISSVLEASSANAAALVQIDHRMRHFMGANSTKDTCNGLAVHTEKITYHKQTVDLMAQQASSTVSLVSFSSSM